MAAKQQQQQKNVRKGQNHVLPYVLLYFVIKIYFFDVDNFSRAFDIESAREVQHLTYLYHLSLALHLSGSIPDTPVTLLHRTVASTRPSDY